MTRRAARIERAGSIGLAVLLVASTLLAGVGTVSGAGTDATTEADVGVEGDDRMRAATAASTTLSDGRIVGYERPKDGATYELDTWYEVTVRVKNTGEQTQTYEVSALERTGQEAKDATKNVTLDAGASGTVTFEQRLYGGYTGKREFRHELYAVGDGDAEKVDEANLTLTSPDVGTLRLEFVDGDGETVGADFELRDEDGKIVRDSRGDKVYQDLPAGEYTISATASGHHETFRSVTLDPDADRTVTVVVPSKDYDVSVDGLSVADSRTTYQHDGTVTVEAAVNNTGDVEHTYFVGFSVVGPEGRLYDNNGTTGTTVTLSPGETETVTLTWDVEADAPVGEYDLLVVGWWESDRESLRTAVERETRDGAFGVFAGDLPEVSIQSGRPDGDADVDSTVALRADHDSLVDPYRYEWEVVDSPGDWDLLWTSGRVTSFTPRAEGRYEIEVTAYVGDDVADRDTVVIDASENDVFGGEMTEGELIDRYSPILHFHENETYFPTRYEMLVENSTLFVDGERISSPTMFDLASVESADAYLDPTKRDDYKSALRNASKRHKAVYANVNKSVEFNDEQYTALVYWMVYTNDPKHEENVGEIISLFAHTGDHEPVVILFDQQGNPQWVGAQQHFGGEFREWEEVKTDGTHVEIYPALGAHSNFLTKGVFQYQSQFLPDEGLGGGLKSTLTFALRPDDETDAITGLHLGDGNDVYVPIYNDYTGTRTEWSRGSPYEIYELTNNETWSDYSGNVSSYTAFTKHKGQIPTEDPLKWHDIGTWFDEYLISQSEQIGAKFVSPATSVSEAPLDDPDAGTKTVRIKNTDVKTHPFYLTVESQAVEGGRSYHQEIRVPLQPDEAPEKSVQVVPEYAKGEWEVTLTLADYSEDVREESDVEDTRTFTVSTGEPEVDATVEYESVPQSTYGPGENVNATVRVTNTGKETHTFFVGYSAVGPEGDYYDDGGTTGTTVELAPDESDVVELSWTPPDDAPPGQYDLLTAAWYESDRTALRTQLDDDWATKPVTVNASSGTSGEIASFGETQAMGENRTTPDSLGEAVRVEDSYVENTSVETLRESPTNYSVAITQTNDAENVTVYLRADAVTAGDPGNLTMYLDGSDHPFEVVESAGPGERTWVAFNVPHFSTRTVSFVTEKGADGASGSVYFLGEKIRGTFDAFGTLVALLVTAVAVPNGAYGFFEWTTAGTSQSRMRKGKQRIRDTFVALAGAAVVEGFVGIVVTALGP